jgi:ABC-2 type transport system permease protein
MLPVKPPLAVASFLALILAAGTTALMISGISIPGAVWAAVPWTGVWFLAGFAMYAFLYALAGVLVSRQEDAQSAATPVNTFLLGGYIVMFILVSEPDSLLARVLSLLPPLTPSLMPMRGAADAVHPVELGAALALTAVTITVLVVVAARIYATLVLQRGSRVRWADALGMGR